jgi:CoA:oxalate CoA-transferase
MQETSKPGPLAGVTVLDFTRVLAGPFCTAMLGDLGAEVIKVEPPQGDEYRHVGPFRAGESALFQLVNRNKRGLALDLKKPSAQAIAGRLAAGVDVVVENFKPGVAARLGIDYARLSEANPALVYASISGFGQTGPMAHLPAFDLIAQALSGLMDLTGETDGPPTRVGESLGDLSAGLYASWAILAALFERERTGRGRYLDVAMVDSLISLLPTAMAQSMFGDSPPVRVGNRHPLSTPFGAYRAKDGHLVICVLNAGQFARLAASLGRPELAEDPRYASDSLRTEHEAELRAVIEAWLATRTTEEAVAVLSEARVPAAAILPAEAVLTGAQVEARGLMPPVNHPVAGEIQTMEQPVHFLGLPRGRQRPSPALGAQGREILARRLGLDAAEIAGLEAEGALIMGDDE